MDYSTAEREEIQCQSVGGWLIVFWIDDADKWRRTMIFSFEIKLTIIIIPNHCWHSLEFDGMLRIMDLEFSNYQKNQSTKYPPTPETLIECVPLIRNVVIKHYPFNCTLSIERLLRKVVCLWIWWKNYEGEEKSRISGIWISAAATDNSFPRPDHVLFTVTIFTPTYSRLQSQEIVPFNCFL